MKTERFDIEIVRGATDEDEVRRVNYYRGDYVDAAEAEAEITELHDQIDVMDATIDGLNATIAELRDEILALEERVADLRFEARMV